MSDLRVTPSVPLTLKNYMRVLTKREQLIRSLEQFMAGYDLLLCPVSTTAFPHHQKTKMVGNQPIYKKPLYIDGKPQNYWIATTCYANLHVDVSLAIRFPGWLFLLHKIAMIPRRIPVHII
ncbi:hypothetical protein [uncultured Brevibacillus sp.]|uniref:hypothetical protein n=1 Tax=uncultured Brevibacillus sp. TaxID=169970 RepID=UPI0025920213|nr:hypothetical protein [uncultured Brevibacillus sp.]